MIKLVARRADYAKLMHKLFFLNGSKLSFEPSSETVDSCVNLRKTKGLLNIVPDSQE